jgi:hypothetical protein
VSLQAQHCMCFVSAAAVAAAGQLTVFSMLSCCRSETDSGPKLSTTVSTHTVPAAWLLKIQPCVLTAKTLIC